MKTEGFLETDYDRFVRLFGMPRPTTLPGSPPDPRHTDRGGKRMAEKFARNIGGCIRAL